MATDDNYENEAVAKGINEEKLSEEDKSDSGENMQSDPMRPRHLVEKVDFPPVSEDQVPEEKFGIDVFKGVKMKISGELGKTSIRVRDLINLQEGSMLKLDRLADENLTMLVNEAPFAFGEVVVINDRYGVRITSFFDEDPKEDN